MKTFTADEAAQMTWYPSPTSDGWWRLYDRVSARPYRVDFELSQWFSREEAVAYAREKGLRLSSDGATS